MLWPVRIILPDELGVMAVLGRWHFNLKPMLYVIIPGFMDVHKVTITEQICDFPQMALTTKDGEGIILDGTISYTINDPYKAIFKVHDLDATLQSKAMGAICDIVSRLDRKKCIKQDKLKQQIEEELEEYEDAFGFEIEGVDITTNIKAFSIFLSK
jgi:regulator of protease activity HflC (stomatin/prohibitin superfamily)